MHQFCFVHASDLHLDTPFDGVCHPSSRIAEALCNASLGAWDALVQLSIDHGAACLLLAGDIYDGPERGVRAQLHFRRGLQRLAEHGVRTFIVHGNHDSPDGWAGIRDWPPGVTRFGCESVEAVGLERDGERVATVHGISYREREMTENLALRFRRGPEDGIHIGLLHCNVGGHAEHAAYSPCSLEDLRAAGMDYWALGHIHRREFLSEGDPWIVYCGTLQGRSVRPAEAGPKGAVVVDVAGDRISGVTFHALDRVRFVRVAVDVANIANRARLHSTLAETAARLHTEHEGRVLILLPALTGRGELHRDLRRPGVLDELLKDLQAQADDEDAALWWNPLRDETGPPFDRTALQGRGDFSGELLRLVDTLTNDPKRASGFLRQRFAALPADLGSPAVPDVDADEARALLQAAETRALDVLKEDDWT
jgi:DNA repair exonuclease SbcCD nuclease subunit